MAFNNPLDSLLRLFGLGSTTPPWLTPGANPNEPHPLSGLPQPRNPFDVSPHYPFDVLPLSQPGSGIPGQDDPLQQLQALIAQLQQPREGLVQSLLGKLPGAAGDILGSPQFSSLAQLGIALAKPEYAPGIAKVQSERRAENLSRQRTAALLQSQLSGLQEQRRQQEVEQKEKAAERKESRDLRRLESLVRIGSQGSLKAAERILKRDGTLQEGETLAPEIVEALRVGFGPEGLTLTPEGQGPPIKTVSDLKSFFDIIRDPQEATKEEKNLNLLTEFMKARGQDVTVDDVRGLLGLPTADQGLSDIEKEVQAIKRAFPGIDDESIRTRLRLIKKPPAAQKGQAAQQAGMEVLKLLREMSLGEGGINTGMVAEFGGTPQKIVGGFRRVGAHVGLDDQVKLYRDTMEGFIPLFARMVGHTGVLTEPDVQKTMLLFPQPGESEELAEAKYKNIIRIIQAQQGIPGVSDSSNVPTQDKPEQNTVIAEAEELARRTGLSVEKALQFLREQRNQ